MTALIGEISVNSLDPQTLGLFRNEQVLGNVVYVGWCGHLLPKTVCADFDLHTILLAHCSRCKNFIKDCHYENYVFFLSRGGLEQLCSLTFFVFLVQQPVVEDHF